MKHNAAISLVYTKHGTQPLRAALPLRSVCRAKTLHAVSWDLAFPCACPRPEPAELAGCIYSLHVTTTNSHPVHRRHVDDTLMSRSGRRLLHFLCCDDDDDDFLLMGLVYPMPSTIMCTYQSYHDDTGQSN